MGQLFRSTTARTVLAVPKVDACLQTTAEFLHSPVSKFCKTLDKVLFLISNQNTPFLSGKTKNFAPDIV